jgi:hypothetical protein
MLWAVSNAATAVAATVVPEVEDDELTDEASLEIPEVRFASHGCGECGAHTRLCWPRVCALRR